MLHVPLGRGRGRGSGARLTVCRSIVFRNEFDTMLVKNRYEMQFAIQTESQRESLSSACSFILFVFLIIR